MMGERYKTPNGELAPTKITPRIYGRNSLQTRSNGSPASSASSTPWKIGIVGESRTSGPKADQLASPPIQTVLNSNVTPRSSARKTRRESGFPTSRAQSPAEIAAVGRTAQINTQVTSVPVSGYTTPITGPLKRTSASSNAGSQSRSNHLCSGDSSPRGSGLTSPEPAPKFFHASDVGSILSQKSPSPLSSPEHEQPQPKFFHANGDMDMHSPPLRTGPAPLLRQSPRPFAPSPQPPRIRPPRAPSPLKDELVSRKSSVTKPSPRRHTRLSSNGSTAAEQDIRLPGSTITDSRSSSRRSSVSSPVAHSITRPKSLSLDKTNHLPTRRGSLTLSDCGPPPAAPYSRPGSAASRSRRGSIVYVDNHDPSRSRPVLATIPSQSLPPPENPPPMSPIRTSDGQSKLEHMNELAANARRDRKVLDLEISNSSLLAINRTLEREMRKHQDELRNLRKFARTVSGRVSSNETSSRISELSVLRPSDLLIEGFSDDQLSDRDDQSLSSTDSSSPPTSDYIQSAIPRIRRSTKSQTLKNLHLEDLARQRALLLDGQKLNQAIKRCLDSTEILIADGKKALAYKAEIEETEPRCGRVLTRDIEEEGLDQDDGDGWTGMRQGLLSPTIEWRSIRNPWEPQDFTRMPTTEDPPLPRKERVFSGDLESRPVEVDSSPPARVTPSPEQALPGAIVDESVENVNNISDDDGSYSPPSSPSPQPIDTSFPIYVPSDPLPQPSSFPALPSSLPSPRPSTFHSSPPAPPSSDHHLPLPSSSQDDNIKNDDGNINDEVSIRSSRPSSSSSRLNDPSSPAPPTPPSPGAPPPPKARPLSIASLGLGMGNYLQSLQGSLGLN